MTLFTIASGYKARIVVDNRLRTCKIIAAPNSGIVTLRWKDNIYWRHRDQLLPPKN